MSFLGEIHRSKRGFYRFAGVERRRPGSSAQPLQITENVASSTASSASNTNSNTYNGTINPRSAKHEFFHWTVRVLMAKGSAECRHLKSWSTEKTDRGVFWIPDDSPATKRFPEHKVSEEEESLLTNWLQAAYEEEQDLKSTTAPRVHAQLVAGEGDEHLGYGNLPVSRLLSPVPGIAWSGGLDGSRVRHRVIAPEPRRHLLQRETILTEPINSIITDYNPMTWRNTSRIIFSLPGTSWSKSKTVRLPIDQTLTQFTHRTIVDVLWTSRTEMTPADLNYAGA